MLFRARQQTARMLAKPRQQVNALLLRHGMFYQESTKWTLRHKAWLHRKQLRQLEAQLSFEADLELVATLEGYLKRLEVRIKYTAADCQYTHVIHALMCFRGIDLATGFGLAVKVGDRTGFSARTIGAYLALVPSGHSSGTSRSQGPVTKSGHAFVRKMLIEASWQHAKPYKRPGTRLVPQADLVAPETRLRAIEGNHRLHRVWVNFDQRGKKRTKANTVRHRLNSHGDRRLNQALDVIARVRMRCNEETKLYVEQRTAEGKTYREIKRLLKCYLARRILRQLQVFMA